MTATRPLTVSQAARLLKVSVDAVHKLCRAGKLPATKTVDGYWNIQLRDVTARLKAKRNGASR